MFKHNLKFLSVLTGLILSALLLSAHLVYLYLSDAAKFPINTIKISATYQHISHKELETILEKYSNFSFFSLSVAKLRKELLTLEWTEKAQVSRKWPDILKITLVEKSPIAIWNQALITEEGHIFNEGVEQTGIYLPKLKGAKNQREQVLHVYKKMSKIVASYGMQVEMLEKRKNEAWELTLTNGIRLQLGKHFLLLRLNRFCKAYPAVFRDRLEQLASVDLRYPRGMAIQWKTETRP